MHASQTNLQHCQPKTDYTKTYDGKIKHPIFIFSPTLTTHFNDETNIQTGRFTNIYFHNSESLQNVQCKIKNFNDCCRIRAVKCTVIGEIDGSNFVLYSDADDYIII